MLREITIEITNYCPHGCKYCSSNAISNINESRPMGVEMCKKVLLGENYDIIHLSGGEPLSNPDFYKILQICKEHAKDVVVHTNALTHLAYNANVIDGVYLEPYLTIMDNVNQIHILKRVKQGRELTRPEVHFSSNFTRECLCDHRVIRYDGTVARSPCQKDRLC